MQQIRFVWTGSKPSPIYESMALILKKPPPFFRDPLLLVIPDLEHSQAEERWIALGKSRHQLLLVVVHTETDQSIRIISARKADPKERRDYEEQGN